jgi:hypothetical protein
MAMIDVFFLMIAISFLIVAFLAAVACPYSKLQKAKKT